MRKIKYAEILKLMYWLRNFIALGLLWGGMIMQAADFDQWASKKQTEALQWNPKLEKLSEHEWQLELQTTLPKGWHIYAKSGEIEGVEGVDFSFNDGTLKAAEIRRLSRDTLINDQIFANKATVLLASNTWLIRFKFADAKHVPATLHATIAYQKADAEHFLPETVDLDIPLAANAAAPKSSLKIANFNLENPVVKFVSKGATVGSSGNNSYLELFFLGFLGGLLALLTPCVFPMIPLTISFFSKKASSRQESIRSAISYGLSIIAIYVALSIPFHVLDQLNPNILNSVATSPSLNLVFFGLFLVFAISFFGAFEISLPSSLGNMADSQSRARKGLGIFFMALTLSIVSFSCTGPILGSLLAGSLSNSGGGANALTAGLLGFGFALALPFTLLAFFPHSLAKLPKSGAWMSSFKVTLGFFELAFALKFLSNADLIWHWGILKREIFVGLWVLLGLVYFSYLFGLWLSAAERRKLGLLRKTWGLLIIGFTLYMALGLPKKPYSQLSLLSGFAPPAFYSIYAHDGDCVLNLNCEHDYAQALAVARKTGKPILIDFTGWACVNCRKMEENVWSNPEVYQLIRDNFILLSLYVDDRASLPAAEQIYGYQSASGLKLNIVTVGDKWSTFETENFHNNAQPLYAVLSPDEKLLISPVGYMPDIASYKQWLEQSLQALHSRP